MASLSRLSTVTVLTADRARGRALLAALELPYVARGPVDYVEGAPRLAVVTPEAFAAVGLATPPPVGGGVVSVHVARDAIARLVAAAEAAGATALGPARELPYGQVQWLRDGDGNHWELVAR